MKPSGYPLAATLTICAGLLAAAQQQTPPQFRVTADLVLLDVSVLDRSRRPIKGLTAEDFTILEDGVPQAVATFSAVDLPEAEVLPAKWMGRAALDVQTNHMPDGRLVIIYLDERMVNASPFAGRTTTEMGHAIIDRLSPNDVAAVAFVLDHRNAQEFTTDRARLHAAVDKFSASAYVPVSILGTLRDLSQLLGAIPERRKVIIYVGVGQGFDIEVLSTMNRVTTQGTGFDSLSRPEQQNQFSALLSLFRVAQRANVNIYTVDPNGLDNTNPGSAPKEFLRLIANSTGGRAVIGNNVPTGEVPRMLAENASYYLMTFRSSNSRNEGKFRRIEVKVNRPNVEVRTRRGYVEGRTAGPTVQAGVNPALGRLIPATQLSLGLWAAPAVSDPSGSHAVAMMIDVGLPRQGAPPVEHLAVAYSIVDMSGRERASGKQDLAVSPPRDGASAAYIASVKGVANLPPGRYDIRISAHAAERNRRGGLIGDLVVPDFSKDALSASGVFIGEAAPGIAAPGDPLGRLMSLAPTTERVFDASAPVVAAMRIYQAKQPAAPVSVKTVILDAKDKAVFEATQRFEPALFATPGFADYRLPLPLAKLGSGQFLLRLEASRSGAPVVKREVRIEVR